MNEEKISGDNERRKRMLAIRERPKVRSHFIPREEAPPQDVGHGSDTSLEDLLRLNFEELEHPAGKLTSSPRGDGNPRAGEDVWRGFAGDESSRRGRKRYQAATLATAVAVLNCHRRRHGDRLTNVSAFDAIEAVAGLISGLAPSNIRALKTLNAKRVGHIADVLHHLETALRSLDQLHRCAICGAWFVPVRTDQKCCSEDCANTLRVRRHRANRAAYEQTRKLKGRPEKESK